MRRLFATLALLVVVLLVLSSSVRHGCRDKPFGLIRQTAGSA